MQLLLETKRKYLILKERYFVLKYKQEGEEKIHKFPLCSEYILKKSINEFVYN